MPVRLLLTLCLFAAGAAQAWHDSASPFRKQIEINGDVQKIAADDIATADFYSGGVPGAENIRVFCDDGRPTVSRVLMTGPGDRVHIAFMLLRGYRYYYVYFGNPQPAAAAKPAETLPVQRGMLLEIKRLVGRGPANSFAQIEPIWARSTELVGRTYIANPFQGFNPFNEEVAVIMKYSGSLACAADGEYGFALSASEKGGLYIDSKPVIYATAGPGNVRFNAKIELKQGKHELMIYQFNQGGDPRLSAAWQPPGQSIWTVIPPVALGAIFSGTAGMMEEKDKPLTADMKIDYLGECFFANHYAHQYRFSDPAVPRAAANPVKFEWDFGDGQTAATPQADHVFLQDGLYTVTLTLTQGATKLTRSNRMRATRLWEKINDPPVANLAAAAKIVATYAVEKIPAAALPWATIMQVRATQADPAEKIALRLAATRNGFDAAAALEALTAASDYFTGAVKADVAARIWNAVPVDSAAQPQAAVRQANVLLWRLADFPSALNALEAQTRRRPADRELLRLQGQALVLCQRAAEGKKILEQVPGEAVVDRKLALTGAAARTTEYYIMESDVAAGEESWARWQVLAPADFLEGYSVWLKMQLMEKAKYPAAAAKLAEAFVLAVPQSSYAPKLLDRASRLLEKTDPAKSKALREMLRQKYPEDPLAQ